MYAFSCREENSDHKDCSGFIQILTFFISPQAQSVNLTGCTKDPTVYSEVCHLLGYYLCKSEADTDESAPLGQNESLTVSGTKNCHVQKWQKSYLFIVRISQKSASRQGWFTNETQLEHQTPLLELLLHVTRWQRRRSQTYRPPPTTLPGCYTKLGWK